MVKRISSLASNEKFQVRFLVELLKHIMEGQTDRRRDLVGSRPSLRDKP